MNEPFTIPIGDEEYKARFERFGYTHRIAVLIGQDTVVFEPDEEGSYRALGSSDNVSLVQAIAERLKTLLN